jgi:hypothetical protein
MLGQRLTLLAKTAPIRPQPGHREITGQQRRLARLAQEVGRLASATAWRQNQRGRSSPRSEDCHHDDVIKTMISPLISGTSLDFIFLLASSALAGRGIEREAGVESGSTILAQSDARRQSEYNVISRGAFAVLIVEADAGEEHDATCCDACTAE